MFVDHHNITVIQRLSSYSNETDRSTVQTEKLFIMMVWKWIQNENDFSDHRGITVSLSLQFTSNLVFNHLETKV